MLVIVARTLQQLQAAAIETISFTGLSITWRGQANAVFSQRKSRQKNPGKSFSARHCTMVWGLVHRQQPHQDFSLHSKTSIADDGKIEVCQGMFRWNEDTYLAILFRLE